MIRKRTIVISNLNCGGAQRVATMMANHWTELGCEVSILTLAGGESTPFFPLHPDVRLIHLGKTGHSASMYQAITSNVARFDALRKALREVHPDVVISFLDTTNVLTLLASIGLGMKVAVTERTNPAAHRIGKIWEALRRWTYPHAAAIGVQTEGAKQYFPAALHNRIQVIKNPVLPPQPLQRPDDLTGPSVLAVGRLSEEKRFDLLIRVFSRLHASHPDWHLTILGDGGLRNTLIDLINKLEMDEYIHLPGFREAAAHLEHADLFALTSLYEGFPNALLEALSLGVPVVTFDCPYGPAEILSSVPGGILVENGNEAALERALAELMDDGERRRALGELGRRVNTIFSIEAVMADWEAMITEATER